MNARVKKIIRGCWRIDSRDIKKIVVDNINDSSLDGVRDTEIVQVDLCQHHTNEQTIFIWISKKQIKCSPHRQHRLRLLNGFMQRQSISRQRGQYWSIPEVHLVSRITHELQCLR